jgi:hypothetical protein
MTDQQHPITPPPELRRQWLNNDHFPMVTGTYDLLSITRDRLNSVMDQAAQWSADQELEACCEWLDREGWSGKSRQLRAARRPKPPSLKEQALQVLKSAPGPDYPRVMTVLNADEHALIRQALEALPND